MPGFMQDDLQRALDYADAHVKSVAYTPPVIRTVIVTAAAATWVTGAAGHLPRVQITGPYGSGKSTLLSALQPLVQNPVRNSGLLSTTFAYRNDFRDAVGPNGEVPVSIVDETKHIFGPTGTKGSQHPLYTIATEGYSADGAMVKFQVNDGNVAYSCYQVMFLAGRGERSLPEDVIDRSIRCILARKPDGMRLESLGSPQVQANGRQYGAFLRSSIMAGFDSLKVIVRTTDWYKQHKLDSRDADKWVILFAIAKLAGGKWPALVQAAYTELGTQTARSLPAQLQVIVDMLAFTQLRGTDRSRIPARDLIGYLQELGRSCYTYDGAPYTIKRFGMELKQAGVTGTHSNSTVWYSVSEKWLREAAQLANPATQDLADPENDWGVLGSVI